MELFECGSEWLPGRAATAALLVSLGVCLGTKSTASVGVAEVKISSSVRVLDGCGWPLLAAVTKRLFHFQDISFSKIEIEFQKKKQ